MKRKSITINGVMYKSYRELAKAYDLTPSILSNRLKQGLTGEELVKPPKYRVTKKFGGATINGKRYTTLSGIAEEFCLVEMTLRDRYNSGLRDGDLLYRKKPKQKKFPGVEIHGKFYRKISDIANDFEISSRVIRDRYRKGARGEELISTKRLYYKPRSVSKHKNVYYNKAKKLYIYHTMHKGKHYEWARKSLDDILLVKEQVETSLKNDRSIPKILDPQADRDYVGLLPVGSVVGQWTILSVFKKQERYYANCQCSCGKTKDVYCASLTSGKSTNCGHDLQSLMTTSDYQTHAHDKQNKRKEPNINNKLRERYISLDKRGRYYVSVTRHGLIVRQYFYNLDKAISFRDKLLEDIDKNDGKIPQHYPTKVRK